MSNQERPKLSELIKSLKTHKDAILILGDKVAPNAVKITESSKETFNRKCMVKSPSKFWEWYNENVFFASPTISNEETATTISVCRLPQSLFVCFGTEY